MIGYIYKIVNPSNKVYIGQTIDLYQRKIHYKKLHCSKQLYLYNSIIKHGWENHSFEIIEEIDKESLNEREKYWINYYNSFKEGMNLTTGGDNYELSEVSKNKISIANKGSNNGMFGRSGNLHPRYGKKASEETRERLKVSHLGKMKGINNPSFKGLILAYKNGVLYEKFESSNQAGEVLGIQPRNIRAVILGDRKSAGGYTFTREQ